MWGKLCRGDGVGMGRDMAGWDGDRDTWDWDGDRKLFPCSCLISAQQR